MKTRIARLLAELRRRRVFKVFVLYVVAAWVIVEVAATVVPLLRLPYWVATLVLLLAILGLPIVVLMAWVYDVTPAGIAVTASADAAASVDKRSIAVLPFVDMSAERDQEYLGDSVAEEILNVLAKLPHLRVAARTSAFAFKGKSEDVRSIGKQLGVAAVLEGSIRKAGNRIRITTQLIDVGNGYHLWSERYDRELNDIFAIQDEIAQNIAHALNVTIGGEKPHVDSITTNMRAYDYYLRGRAGMMLYRRQTIEEALHNFRKAIELDPNYAAAHAAAADASCKLYDWSTKRDPEILQQAAGYAQRAVKLAPDLALAHVAHGHVLSREKKTEDAAHAFQRALQLEPFSFEVHYQYARSAYVLGKAEEAAEHFRRAAELRVEDYQSMALLSTVYHALGRPDEARAASRTALERIERQLALLPYDARAWYMGALAHADLGDKELAHEWAERALGVDPADPAILYNLACMHARLGETDLAIQRLEQSVAHGHGMRQWLLNDSDLAVLHGDARFQRLVASMPE